MRSMKRNRLVNGELCVVCGLILVVGLLVLSGCAETPQVTATANATDTPIKATVQPTSTPQPTNTPLPPVGTDTTLPPTTVEFITSPEPQIAEIEAYLRANTYPGWEEVAKVFFRDVSGDGQADIVAVTDQAPVFVFIWQGDHYGHPQQTGSWDLGIDGADGRYLYFSDYTGDKVPELVNDSWHTRGTDEYVAVDWQRQITTCDQEHCWVIWEDWTGTYAEAPIATGMFYYNSSDNYYRTETNQLVMERRYFGFGAFWEYTGDVEPVLHPQQNAVALGWDTTNKIYRDVELIRYYVYDGERYVFQSDEVVTEPELIAEDSNLQALGPKDADAFIRLELDQTSPTYRNDRCELYLNGESVSDAFLCKFRFTKLAWEDVIGERDKELVVTTFAGEQAYLWADLIAEKGCFHQRLQVYTWDGENLDQVANIVGCVRRANMFGVKIEDYDSDGQNEILAAVFWPEFLEPEQPDGISQDYLVVNQDVEIYEWDGEKFVIGWTIGE